MSFIRFFILAVFFSGYALDAFMEPLYKVQSLVEQTEHIVTQLPDYHLIQQQQEEISRLKKVLAQQVHFIEDVQHCSEQLNLSSGTLHTIAKAEIYNTHLRVIITEIARLFNYSCVEKKEGTCSAEIREAFVALLGKDICHYLERKNIPTKEITLNRDLYYEVVRTLPMRMHPENPGILPAIMLQLRAANPVALAGNFKNFVQHNFPKNLLATAHSLLQ